MTSSSDAVAAPSTVPAASKLRILGTSHVSAASSRAVAAAISHVDLVAIELDAGRAHAIMSGERSTFAELRAALGLKTAIIAFSMRSLQERIAKSLGVVPGLEMKAALEAATKSDKTIALIDRDVRQTLKRLSASLGFQELKSFIRDMFRRRKISTHPSDAVVLELLAEMKTRYPRVYAAMVSERDEYMVRQLTALRRDYPGQNILVVVGKGHVPGMSALLTTASIEHILLDDGAHIMQQ